MNYVVSSRAISQNFDIACKTAEKNGFDIEVDCEHLKDYVDANVEPYLIHLPYNKVCLTHPDERIRKRSVQRMIKELQKAHLKKVRLAVLHIEGGYEHSPKIPVEKKAAYFKMAGSEILEYANKFGLKIALENNGFAKDSFSKPEEILMVIEDLAEKYTNVGLCFDTGHANVYAHNSGRDLVEVFEKLKKYVIHVHLHENHGQKDEHLPPQGIFGKAFYRKLLALGNVSLTFETKGPSGMEGILKGIELIRR